MNPNILKRAKDKQRFQIEKFQKNLRLFINECMCRRESNQMEADKLWEEVAPYLKESDRSLFLTEWKGHYIHTGEHTPDDFAGWIDEILKPYLDE